MKVASPKFHLKAQLRFHLASTLGTLLENRPRIHEYLSSPLVNRSHHLELFLELAVPYLKHILGVQFQCAAAAMEVLLFKKG